uniref:Uncharacterized protein n=1 Tax=Mesocestoides corti TaxID=53468 RepID=A0A5K3G331_MESCO
MASNQHQQHRASHVRVTAHSTVPSLPLPHHHSRTPLRNAATATQPPNSTAVVHRFTPNTHKHLHSRSTLLGDPIQPSLLTRLFPASPSTTTTTPHPTRHKLPPNPHNCTTTTQDNVLTRKPLCTRVVRAFWGRRGEMQ